MKNNKIKLFISILFLTTLFLGLIGVTFSYFNNTSTFENEFNAGVFSTSATEVFNSPTDWRPGDTTPKTLSIKNEGNIPMAVRVSYTESWKDSNNQDLPLSVNNIKSVIVDLDNTDKWSKRGNYYYYNGSLGENETAESPVKSVTFNKDIVSDTACTTTNGVTSCESTYNGYENSTYTLTFTIETVQYNMMGEAWPEASLYYAIKEEYDSGSGYAGLYTGSHKDSFTREATKDIYYYTGDVEDKINVMLGGYCWQMYRTTDTGGVKMIYNGPQVDGKCEDTRGSTRKLNINKMSNVNMTGTYYYGTNFILNPSDGKFRISGEIINDDYLTNEDVIGMYTCKSTNVNAECTYLHKILYDNPENDNFPYIYRYTYSLTTTYANIGYSEFNRESNSLAYVGYMYNKVYEYNKIDSNVINKYGSSVTWNGSSYILNNVVEIESGTSPADSSIKTHHYFCIDNNTQCSSVGFIYIYRNGGTMYYIKLENGVDSVGAALNDMLNNDNVNVVDSSIKELVDLWYKLFFLNYDSYLEETIYCNNRTIGYYGGWDPNGYTNQGSNSYINFKDHPLYLTNDLNCDNISDQFSISNNKAKLTYKVGLISAPEIAITNILAIRKNEGFTISPHSFGGSTASVIEFTRNTSLSPNTVNNIRNVRPVISLAPGYVPARGNGTMADPYVIE